MYYIGVQGPEHLLCMVSEHYTSIGVCTVQGPEHVLYRGYNYIGVRTLHYRGMKSARARVCIISIMICHELP